MPVLLMSAGAGLQLCFPASLSFLGTFFEHVVAKPAIGSRHTHLVVVVRVGSYVLGDDAKGHSTKMDAVAFFQQTNVFVSPRARQAVPQYFIVVLLGITLGVYFTSKRGSSRPQPRAQDQAAESGRDACQSLVPAKEITHE